MLFFCELYVIRDELALLGRTAHHPRSWASTSYNYNRSWASTSYNYNYQLPADAQIESLSKARALPPYTAMSTSGGGAVIDSMDTTTDPSPGSQGALPPLSPGPRDEAGAADEGTRPRTRQNPKLPGEVIKKTGRRRQRWR